MSLTFFGRRFKKSSIDVNFIFRKPGIYKAEYIKELFSRYGDVSDTLAGPELPDWYILIVFHKLYSNIWYNPLFEK